MTEMRRLDGWHHRLNGHEFGSTPGVGDGQGGLACCSPWGCQELDVTEWLNWTELGYNIMIRVGQWAGTRLWRNLTSEYYPTVTSFLLHILKSQRPDGNIPLVQFHLSEGGKKVYLVFWAPGRKLGLCLLPTLSQGDNEGRREDAAGSIKRYYWVARSMTNIHYMESLKSFNWGESQVQICVFVFSIFRSRQPPHLQMRK